MPEVPGSPLSRPGRRLNRILALLPALLLLALPAHGVLAQDRGAAALDQMVRGLGNSARVLVIAAHPDDEDTSLIAWLARSERVETAYLSLTRGDGGQNLIGNELGEGLGAIRTEELLAARAVDGGQQFFTRAYDFGFSRSAEETFQQWGRDSILGDVVRVVRTFRPHVIVSIFTGTPRDGHGHHQAAGQLAREVFEQAPDTTRFSVASFGVPWVPLKFYRSAWFNREGATLEIQVGELDPVLGRSFAEIAGESRSRHSSQGFGALQRRGPVSTFVSRVASRVPAGDPMAERSLLDGVDTAWTRFRDLAPEGSRSALDALPAAFADVLERLDLARPATVVQPLLRVRQLLDSACAAFGARACDAPGYAPGGRRAAGGVRESDLLLSLQVARARADSALRIATGVQLEAEFARPALAMGSVDAPVVVRTYNRGRDALYIGSPGSTAAPDSTDKLSPGGVRVDTLRISPDSVTGTWWLRRPREGSAFRDAVWYAESALPQGAGRVDVPVSVEAGGGSPVFSVRAPIVYRVADPVRGDVSTPLAVVPAISLTPDRAMEVVTADRPVARAIRVRVQSAVADERAVTVRLDLPSGLQADSAERIIRLAGGEVGFVTFRVRGELPAGTYVVGVSAESEGAAFRTGYELVDYPHIRPQRLYRESAVQLVSVDAVVPAGLSVGYIRGVGDDVAPVLEQLGMSVELLRPADLSGAALSRFGGIVVGPRAYESNGALLAANPVLLDYVRNGGTMVVQYQQYQVHAPGVLPFPLEIRRPHDRVTIETAPVRILDASAQLLTWPNRITADDFDGWVQERALYMPHSIDPAYTPLLAMSDPGEEVNRGALLVADYGAGRYVYTSLALFRQLPAGVPGAVRLMVNLLSAGASGGGGR